MINYNYIEDGFTLIPQFFSASELKEIKSLDTLQSIPEISAFAFGLANIPIAKYGVITPTHFNQLASLKRLQDTINTTAASKLNFFNSIYIELQAEKVSTKPGFYWHQDIASFSILEKGRKALFCWFVLENTLENNTGTLELVTRKKLLECCPVDLKERGIGIFPTDILLKMWGIDVRDQGKFVILDAMNSKVIGFFNPSLDDIAEKPLLKPGDLIICNKDIMHRTGHTSSKTGIRSALTLRFIVEGARYNGCLDDGIPLSLYDVYKDSSLWQRLKKEGCGAPIIKW